MHSHLTNNGSPNKKKKKKLKGIFSSFDSSRDSVTALKTVSTARNRLELEFVEFDEWTEAQFKQWFVKIRMDFLVNGVDTLQVTGLNRFEEVIRSGELLKPLNDLEKRRLMFHYHCMRSFQYYSPYFQFLLKKFDKIKGFDSVEISSFARIIDLTTQSDSLEEFFFKNREKREEFDRENEDEDEEMLEISLCLVNHSFPVKEKITVTDLVATEFPKDFVFSEDESAVLSISIEEFLFEWNEFEILIPKKFHDGQVLKIASGKISENYLGDAMDVFTEFNQSKKFCIKNRNSSHFVSTVTSAIPDLKLHFLDEEYCSSMQRVEENGLILLKSKI